MDSARFAKLCRESGLLGGKLTNTAVDLCFTKVKAKVCFYGWGLRTAAPAILCTAPTRSRAYNAHVGSVIAI
jgi:hypothetical protein